MIPRWEWPDARGWIGIGAFTLSVMLLWMMSDRTLREDEFFQTIATVVIANGWISVVSWAYAATKGGGELADKNAQIVDRVANHSTLKEPVKLEEPVEVVSVSSTTGELAEEEKL